MMQSLSSRAARTGAILGLLFLGLDVVLGPGESPFSLRIVYALVLGLAVIIILPRGEWSDGLVCGLMALLVEVLGLMLYLSYVSGSTIVPMVIEVLLPMMAAYPLVGFVAGLVRGAF
jgi:predicted neutral ceramidase superfamily lipid hydrolase